MTRRHLRELLVEDQEPFRLDSYISDRRRQLNKPPRHQIIHPKADSFRQGFLKKWFSSDDSSRYCNPEKSSPLPTSFDALALRARAETAGNNTILLRVPNRTADLLLEAALRIETWDPMDRYQTDRQRQGKSRAGGGKVESLFRKLSKFGPKSRKKDFSQRKNQGTASSSKNQSSYVSNCPCSVSQQTETPLDHRVGRESLGDSEVSDPTVELQSPEVSPTRSDPKDKINDEDNDRRKIHPDDAEAVKKEQSSPVSVLDPPLYDDDEGRIGDPDNEEHEYADGLEDSYTRTKQQLLRKLYRFERLAGLDPVELEDNSGSEVSRKMRVTRRMMKSLSDLVVGDWGVDMDDSVLKGCFTFTQHGMRMGRMDQVHLKEDIAADLEVSILAVLVEELSQEDSF